MKDEAKRKRLSVKFTFIIVGSLSTIWFLVRVIPKPSRAAYPCMRAAAPLMSGFIIYLLALTSTVLVFKRARKFLFESRYVLFSGALVVGMVLAASTLLLDQKRALAGIGAELEAPNQPIGAGVGIKPGRVVWVHDEDATDENCLNTEIDYWSDDSNTDQDVVNEMVSAALMGLSDSQTDEAAWDSIFKYHNRHHGKGELGYNSGEKIVIKLNLNSGAKGTSTTRNSYKTVDTSPQVAYAILYQLINKAGVAPSDISIGDPGRTIDDLFWDKCHGDFQDVKYWGEAEGRMPVVASDEEVFFASDSSVSEVLPRSYVEADYMINIPVLKKHHRGGISLSSKNHFGTFVPFNGSAFHLHPSLPCPKGKADVSNGDYGAYRIFVDFIGHRDIGDKTILYLMDGLWSSTNWAHPPIKWGMTPFNDDYPSSIFASQDPVAFESVGYDFLREEFDADHPTEGTYDPTDHTGPFPQYAGVDDFLHQAASSDNWPVGLSYDPEKDGILLPESLGAHEHWNNATDKQYSRNLGGDAGIELVYIHLNSTVHTDNHISAVSRGVVTLMQNYPNPFTKGTLIQYKLTKSASIKISVYDLGGRLVKILVDADLDAGEYVLEWNGSNTSGSSLNAGVYFCSMEARSDGELFRQSREMILSK